MKAACTTAAPVALPESQRAALINLLADEDPQIYRAVRKKILSYGQQAVEWLRPYTLSREPVLRRHAKELVLYFDRHTADNRFLSFCLKQGEDLDLEQGAWLLAQTQYPGINVQGYQAMLDIFARELRDRLQTGGEARQILAKVNRYVFRDLGFAGNEDNYYDPDNSYLNRVMDRRTGNPISLCLLYMLIARRLHLPLTGIGLPGHFICRYQSIAAEIYIDAFNRGKFLTKGDCVQYLANGNYRLRDDHLAPVSPRRILWRVCGNLHQIYLHLELGEETTRLQRYLIALGR